MEKTRSDFFICKDCRNQDICKHRENVEVLSEALLRGVMLPGYSDKTRLVLALEKAPINLDILLTCKYRVHKHRTISQLD